MATFTVTPSSIHHTKGGETTNVQFSGSVPQGLNYSMSAAVDWVTVTLDGNNTTISSNQNSGAGRKAIVTFYDTNNASNYVDVTIIQEAYAHPSFSVTPGNYYAGRKGGSRNISFSGVIPGNMTNYTYYSIMNNDLVNSGDLAYPSGELDWFSYQNNTITIQEWPDDLRASLDNREGYVRFQDPLDPENYVDLWIHQSYNFQLEPVQIYVPISGGSYYINMMQTSAQSNYSYSALPQWITISPVMNPTTAREEMLVTVSANSSTKRTSSITIKDSNNTTVTFKVSQTGSDTSSYPSFNFIPSSYTFKCCASRYTFIRRGLGYGNDGGYIPYNINVTCPSWMSVVYSDHMEVMVDVEENTGSQRTGSLILTDADNSSNVYTITVTQEAWGTSVMGVYPRSEKWHIIDPTYWANTVVTYNTTVSVSKSANWINYTEISTSTPDSTYTLGPNKKIYKIIPSYNGGSSSRSGYVYFTDSDNNRGDFSVYQAGPFIASPSSISFPYTASSETVTISNKEDTSGVRVNHSDFPDWLHSTEFSYGIDYYTISADKNKYHKTRDFDVEFYDGPPSSYWRKTTVPVTQASNTQAFTVSPSSIDFTIAASTVSVVADQYDDSVSVNTSEFPDWLDCTIASSTNELVRYDISALSNRSQTSRSFTINFTDVLDGVDYSTKSVLVNQSGRDTPVLRCTPSSMSFVSGGGSDTVGVNYYGSLSYDSLPSWLSLTQTSSTPGVKNYYTVTAASNTTNVSRSHSITFTDSEGSVAFPISQEAGSPGPVPVLSVVPSSLSFVSGGGSDSLEVTYNGSLSYNSGEVPGWLGVLSTSVSIGYNTYSVTAASNTGSARTFGLVFTDDDTSVSVPISQDAGSPGPAPISVSPSSLSFTESGGSSTVTVTSSGSVSYSALPDWITMTNSGGVYTVTAASNTGSARTHTITFTDETGSASVVVSQDAGSPAPISVSPSSLSFTESGGSSTVTVTSSGSVSYNALPDWITMTNSGGVYTVTATSNTGAARTHTIIFTDETGSVSVVVSQEASSTVISVSPSSLSFGRNAGSSTVTVTSSGTVSYSALPDWITITNSGDVYTVTVTSNTGSVSRTNTITFTDETGSATLVVTQLSGDIGDNYIPIWKNTLYYADPADFPNGSSLSYKLYITPYGTVYEGYIPFLEGTVRDINISRLVEGYFTKFLDFPTIGIWTGLGSASVITVQLYQKGDPDVLLNTYRFIDDWSYYFESYYTTKTLCAPINGHGSNNMCIPFFAYVKDNTSFTIVETSTTGSVYTTNLGAPYSPVMGGLNSFYGDKKVEFKGGNNTFVTYDLTYCGSGNLVYKNRFGGYDAFLIEGNIEKKEDYTRMNYLNGRSYSYRDKGQGGYTTDDVQIKTSYTAHTGWLTDDQAERLVFHLLSSPNIYYQSFEGLQYKERTSYFNLTKVMITDSSAVYKKFKNGKRMVSYAITFEICDTKKIM